ncbi:MAG: hypothetical protein FWG10_00015 [Eubacteriaceae bacterium]|nr:hypothetical protein [Eubacteriaceae bacterium]
MKLLRDLVENFFEPPRGEWFWAQNNGRNAIFFYYLFRVMVLLLAVAILGSAAMILWQTVLVLIKPESAKSKAGRKKLGNRGGNVYRIKDRKL